MKNLRKKSAQGKVLWVTDPWDTLDHPKDTTLRLIEESLRLKIPAYWADPLGVQLLNGKITLECRRVLSVKERSSTGVEFGESEFLSPTHFKTIHYRPDPPVDAHYIHPLQLIEAGVRGTKTQILNPPSELLLMSEKFVLGLPLSALPKSLISSRWEDLKDFGQRLKKTVVKPLHQAQSKGVELLEWKDLDHPRTLLSQLTSSFTVPVLLQEFLPQIAEGEKRLWFASGKLVGQVLKRPLSGDFRVLVDRGSPITAVKLDSREKKVAAAIGKILNTRKIALAAVDLIDGKVCDFNVTSPGLLVQLEEVMGKNIAREILQRSPNP